MKVHMTHTLADGMTIAYVSMEHTGADLGLTGIDKLYTTYSILLGYTGEYIHNIRTGEKVYTSTHGCVGCDIYTEMAEELWKILCGCTDINSADRTGTDYWCTHLEMRINSQTRIRARAMAIAG